MTQTLSPQSMPRGSHTTKKVSIRGVAFDALTEVECNLHVADSLDRGVGGWVVTPNLDHLRRLVRDKDFFNLCQRADLKVADGMPLLWAAELQGTPLPERVAGSNLLLSLSALAASRGHSVFLMGGAEGTADAASRELQSRFPGLRVVGIHCPPLGFERDAVEMRRLLLALAQSKPDIVFVALGSPKQERLISEIREQFPTTWWLGIGISFSFVSGAVRRAPRWMQRAGLEWLHRLVQEPRRLFRRYVVDGIPFAAGLLVSSTWKGLTTSAPPNTSTVVR